MTLRREHLYIMQHALGADKYGIGQGSKFTYHRNRYVAREGHEYFPFIQELINEGLMISGVNYFQVTNKGIDEMKKYSDDPTSEKMQKEKAKYKYDWSDE